MKGFSMITFQNTINRLLHHIDLVLVDLHTDLIFSLVGYQCIENTFYCKFVDQSTSKRYDAIATLLKRYINYFRTHTCMFLSLFVVEY